MFLHHFCFLSIFQANHVIKGLKSNSKHQVSARGTEVNFSSRAGMIFRVTAITHVQSLTGRFESFGKSTHNFTRKIAYCSRIALYYCKVFVTKLNCALTLKKILMAKVALRFYLSKKGIAKVALRFYFRRKLIAKVALHICFRKKIIAKFVLHVLLLSSVLISYVVLRFDTKKSDCACMNKMLQEDFITFLKSIGIRHETGEKLWAGKG